MVMTPLMAAMYEEASQVLKERDRDDHVQAFDLLEIVRACSTVAETYVPQQDSVR